MRTSAILPLLLILSLCLHALPTATASANTASANEAAALRELIRSRRLLKSSGGDQHWTSSGLSFPVVDVGPQDGLMEADKIGELPGQPQGADFDQYAGYVTVDPSAGRALFYYFVESPQDPSSKPLVLWLNGGPGCSSLGAGAMEELGPFRPKSDGKTLQLNDYAWNNAANVIFLESPAGVGFSYSNTTSDYKSSGDGRTAKDTYTFLVNWLERFPQYKSRDFFITGESYAGHYVPELASTILTNNKITARTIINLKGIAIGNAYVDGNINMKGTYDYYWTHALISDEAHEAIRSNCNFTSGDYTTDCHAAMTSADAEVGDIDPYNIYAPLCEGSSKANTQTTSLKGPDPCIGNYISSYLNLPEVQTALHATVPLPYQWTVCSSVVHWNDEPATMLPTIKQLIASGISVWLFSGDQDSVVPVTSTKYSIDLLGLSIDASWRPWYSNKQVGGYVAAYKGLTFATVRGAGHMVPSYQGDRALTLFSSFLQGNLPPSA